LTRAGALFIVLTLLFGFAAVNTGNNLLYLLVSAFLGFMAVSGLLGHWNLQGMDIVVRPGQELYADVPASLEIFVRNKQRFAARFLICIELQQQSAVIPVLPASEQRSLALPFVPQRRGYQLLPEVRVQSCFPVNFFVRSQALVQNQQFLVFPRPQPGPGPQGEGSATGSDEQLFGRIGFDGDFFGIDDYRSGDPLKAIHWKLSARHDDYKIKRQVQQTNPGLLLDPEDFSGDLEQRLGQCVYLVNRCSRAQQAVGLKLPERRIPPALGTAHRFRILSELAIYDQGE
jgi:uncharacterized protein (DUF58 family)